MLNTKCKTINGLGSIRKKSYTKKNGAIQEYWEVRITTGINPKTGKQIQKSISGKSPAEVIEKARAYTLAEPEQVSSSLLLDEWLDIWQADYLSSVKVSTAYLYKRDIELYISPNLGSYHLDELSSTIIQRFYNRLLHPVSKKYKPLSVKTVKDIHGVLHSALNQAVESGELEKNPDAACKLPRVPKKDISPLDERQISDFIAAIEGHTHEYLYKIALFTGLREGEILGLTWDKVNLQEGMLVVNQQLRKAQQKGGEYYFSSPKNGNSRILSLSPSVVELFKLQQHKQTLMMLDAGSSWIDTNLVFTNKYGDRLSYRTAYDCFKRVVKKIGVPEIRFHDLRHTYAVISIKNGDDIKTVQHNLGHATAAFTLDVYGLNLLFSSGQ